MWNYIKGSAALGRLRTTALYGNLSKSAERGLSVFISTCTDIYILLDFELCHLSPFSSNLFKMPLHCLDVWREGLQ